MEGGGTLRECGLENYHGGMFSIFQVLGYFVITYYPHYEQTWSGGGLLKREDTQMREEIVIKRGELVGTGKRNHALL